MEPAEFDEAVKAMAGAIMDEIRREAKARAEKIRTYNFPQNRLTDHRIGLTLYRVDAIVDGDLDEIIDALTLDEQARKLRELR